VEKELSPDEQIDQTHTFATDEVGESSTGSTQSPGRGFRLTRDEYSDRMGARGVLTPSREVRNSAAKRSIIAAASISFMLADNARISSTDKLPQRIIASCHVG
jgi:hypothetical protein